MTIASDLKSLLPQQYKESVNFNKIIDIFSNEFEQLKIVNEQLKVYRWLNNAIGKQLDVLGIIVVEPRNGRNDIDYRKALFFKIFINTSKGLVEDLIYIVEFITNATIVYYADNPPAGYTIYTDGPDIPNDFHSFLDIVTGGGISVVAYCSYAVADPIFLPTIPQITDTLVTESGDKLVTNDGFRITARYYADDQFDTEILNKVNGQPMGYLQKYKFVDNNDNRIVSDTGKRMFVITEDSAIIGGGILPVVRQQEVS